MACTRAGPWILTALLGLSGCVSQGGASWGARWPAASDLGDAAAAAARSPATWAPLAGAAVLALGHLDENVSRWAVDETPLFGADAESASDDLRTAAKATWLISALAVPSRNVADKTGGLAVGVATLLLEDAVTDGIKDLSNRRRPDGTDDRSFSSGHAGTTSAAATLARGNLDHMDLPRWLDRTLRVGLHGLALGGGWARVEAEKHYVTDVLAGYAVGHFLAAFMTEAFLDPAQPNLAVRIHPVDGGGALTVVLRGP